MIPLNLVKASNATLLQSLPPGIVAVFVGGTSGVGEVTLKLFAKNSVRPRLYIVGRSHEAAERIIAECRIVNPEGEYTFIQKSLDLMKNWEELSNEIKSKEKALNLLFLSAGEPDLSKTKTSEGLHRLYATHIYGRVLFIRKLLPLLNAATGLARVINVDSGGYEGAIEPSDFPALTLSIFQLRGHSASMATLALKHLAIEAPHVSFVNAHPGLVVTKNLDVVPGLLGVVGRAIAWLFGRWLATPLPESAERHLFLSTSTSYKPKTGEHSGVPLVQGLDLHQGVDGERGSGVYSVKWDCDGPGNQVIQLLTEYEENGMMEQVWQHIVGELERVEREFY